VLYLKENIGVHYKSDERLIKVISGNTIGLVPELAHEYTHHVQNCLTKGKMYSNDPLAEGSAVGVERIISNQYAEETGNPGYSLSSLRSTTQTLTYAYLYLCSQRGIQPNDKLLDSRFLSWSTRISRTSDSLFGLKNHNYDIGVAAVSIAEEIHGPSVYARLVRGETDFLQAA
jgi:hypothetical protein